MKTVRNGIELTNTILTDGINTVAVNVDGQLHVVQEGKIDAANSTTTVLDPGGVNVFTGTAVNTLEFAVIQVSVFASHASATDGLSVQFSTDGTNWDNSDEYTIPAATGKTFSFQPSGMFYRVVYTNGGVLQTAFRLQSQLKKTYIKPSSHRIQDSIIGDDDAELQKAVLTAKDPNGIFVNIQATDSENLRVTDAESGLAIAKGDVIGTTFIHKFGEASDFDQADGSVTIWDGANDELFSGSPPMVYTYSSSADIGLISSSDGGDTQDIEIQGLDSNFDLVTQTITLNGQTDVDISATGVDLIRSFRMKNIGSTDLVGVVYLRTNGSAQSGGVPTVANTVRAIINNGNNQTLMALFTIPNGVTGYMRDWFASTAGANRSSEYKIRMFARPDGEVFQLKHTSSVSDTASSSYQHDYEEPEVFQARTDVELKIEMLTAAATQADIAGGFDIVLVDD